MNNSGYLAIIVFCMSITTLNASIGNSIKLSDFDPIHRPIVIAVLLMGLVFAGAFMTWIWDREY